MIEASARASKASQTKWLRPLLAVGGAATFLYAGYQPLVDSPLVCCPRLLLIPGFEPRTLNDAIPLLIPVVSLVAAVRLVLAPDAGPRVVRGVLLSTGLVGAAVIVHEAGGLIAVKGGIPATGALLGFTGASLILATALLWPNTRDKKANDSRTQPIRRVPALGILLGASVFIVALLMPWSNRPFPLRLVGLPAGPYWIWSIVLPAGIVLPTIVAGVRLLRTGPQGLTELGVALGGGIFGTMLFVQVVGRVLSSSFGPFHPVYSLTTGGYLGLGAGSLILASALVGCFFAARSHLSTFVKENRTVS